MAEATESRKALTPAKAKNSQSAPAATAHIIASDSANANEHPAGFSLANFKSFKSELIIPTHNESRPRAGNTKFRPRAAKIPAPCRFCSARAQIRKKNSKKIWKFAFELGKIAKKYRLLIFALSGVRISELKSRIFLKILRADNPQNPILQKRAQL